MIERTLQQLTKQSVLLRRKIKRRGEMILELQRDHRELIKHEIHLAAEIQRRKEEKIESRSTKKPKPKSKA